MLELLAGVLSPEDAPEHYDLALSRFLSLGGPDLEARCGSVLASVGPGEPDRISLPHPCLVVSKPRLDLRRLSCPASM